MPKVKGTLSPIERFHLNFVRESLKRRWMDRTFTLLQQHVGARWIDWCTYNLRTVYGLDHITPFRYRSIVLVANHRSFFDMFVINAVLYREGGFRQRFLFPVRSNFFYDNPAGIVVNGIMSFFSMYPPVFRDRARASLNHQSFQELSASMKAGLRSAGVHPEGTRNRFEDPYTFLPAQSGVGRLIHVSGAPVLPVFINGLQNDLLSQVRSNFTRGGEPIHVLFGPPVELEDLLAKKGNGRIYKAVADRVMDDIAALGQQERMLRARVPPNE
ncbi:MAG: lysophospholipid acyltransferase family protein [Myxococcota bacterium]